MTKIWLLLPLLVLGACATADYAPQVLGQADNEAQFKADVDWCHTAAATYKPPSQVAMIAEGAVSGGLGALSYAPINPAIPALGALGGAASAAASGLDATGQARRNVEKHCVEEKARRDGSAIVANPDN